MPATPQRDDEKKPNDHVYLKVRGQGRQSEVFFGIKRRTKLKKLLNAYCDRQSVDFNSISLVFDGHHLCAEQTPEELQMEDGDEIHAMLHQPFKIQREKKTLAPNLLCEGRSVRILGVTTPQREDDQKPKHINLMVKGQDCGSEVFFRIKRSTTLKKLLNAYCDQQSADFNSISFVFGGRCLRAEQTPEELEMEDGDEIHAVLHQIGGITGSMQAMHLV